jgi:hypothetical protein
MVERNLKILKREPSSTGRTHKRVGKIMFKFALCGAGSNAETSPDWAQVTCEECRQIGQRLKVIR